MNKVIEKNVGKSTLSWLPVSDETSDHDEILLSWKKGNFLFKEDDHNGDRGGLRPPQIGGIFAALGYEKSDEKNAVTIVMPTGTGKTETILSIVVAGKFGKTLVVVPSDSLREQTKIKCIKLGLLRDLGLIDESFKNPIVATIKHGVANRDELKELIESNIIISSASALSKFSNENLYTLTASCTHLIVDEAHHVTAATWARVKASFNSKPIFQFTATPFRTDRSRIEGKIIFNYPLKSAQEHGYFTPIEFHPIKEFVEDKSDLVIAQKAIDLLRKDLSDGLDHIMMARVSTIKRAKEIFKLYASEADLNPVLITSQTDNKSGTLQAINSRKHKIIVCVSMLGEGFDLPQLKISALHDPHKSINILLQFIGRFTRTIKNVGNAKFIANIANPNVNEILEELYKEDSDWNNLISDISSRKILDEKKYQEFRSEFSTGSNLLDLGLSPNISTTIYRMLTATWKPEDFFKFNNKNFEIIDSTINADETILIFSGKSLIPVGWTKSKELLDESWDLYVAYYNKNLSLLFLHSSAKDGPVKHLASIIANDCVQVKGEAVFRAFAGLKRLKLQNIGLNKNKKGLRYSMHTGTEINDQIPDIEASRATKSNIFGKGYEYGAAVSIGCSYKGKIWAMDSDSIEVWIAWCNGVGKKILDDSIDTNQVFKTAMQIEELEEYPNIHPLSVEWPVELLRKNEMRVVISSASWDESLINCELTVAKVQVADNKKLNIELRTNNISSLITISISQKGEVTFKSIDNLSITIGKHQTSITKFFSENPPTIFLADTSVVDGGLRYFPSQEYAYIYDRERVEVWDWSNVDISVESQTTAKFKHSIQYNVIQNILNDYDFVFDDDDSGEVADIVAIRNFNDTRITIDLFHCKYCSKQKGVAVPRARVDDIYEVTGQAEKSLKWFGDKEKLIKRLMERERARLAANKPSRIEKGKLEDLIHLAKVSRYSSFDMGINIVQPAVSKRLMSNDQLSVIGATAAYVDEVSGIKLRVIASM